MKILQINCVYQYGSTGRITAGIHAYLKKQGHESVVCYGRRKTYREPGLYKTCNEFMGKLNHGIARISGMPYGGCGLQTAKLLRILQREQPDLVHIQCPNGHFVNIYRLINYLKKADIPTVITLHAEFMYTANCNHAIGCDRWQQGCGSCPKKQAGTGSLFFDRSAASFRRMQDAFRDFRKLTVVGVSRWITQRAALSPVWKDVSFQTIYNGIDTNVFCPRSVAEGRAMLGLQEGERGIVFVTSFFDRLKGADLFVALTERMPDCKFYVVGASRPLDAPKNITFLGKIGSPERLALLYSGADATVCCSRQDNYPTVCLEAAACGTPVVGFDTGGVGEAIGNGLGIVVPKEDVPAMESALRQVLSVPKETWRQRAEALSLSEDRMCKEYLMLYKRILQEDGNDKRYGSKAEISHN